MGTIILNAKFLDTADKFFLGSTITFELESLKIEGQGLETTIYCGYVTARYDNEDKSYYGGIMFTSVLNSYIRGDKTLAYGQGWEIFDRLKNPPNKDGLVDILFQYDGSGKVKPFTLQYATPGARYYEHSLECMLCDEDGKIISDEKDNYEDELCSAVAKAIKGDEQCLYKGSSIDELIQTYGGPDAFVNEFGT